MKTWYPGHDQVYQKHRAAGLPGWDTTEAGYGKFVSQIDASLAKGNAPQSGRLLELGCGAGNMSLWLAKKGYEVSGVDIAPTAVSWASERAEELGIDAHFTEGNVLDLKDYSDHCFDFVLDGHCLHCIIGGDRRLVLDSVMRVLRPGGYFLVMTMCGPVDPGMHPDFDPTTRCLIVNGIARRYFGDWADILNEVTAAGFQLAGYEFLTDEYGHELVIEAIKPVSST